MELILRLMFGFLCLYPVAAYSTDLFPPSVTFIQNATTFDLKLTGIAHRKKFFINIYSVASYLDSRAGSENLLQEIMKDENAKQLIVKWTHDADKKRVVNGYQDSFRQELSQVEYSELQSEIAHYLSFARDVKKGDEYIIRWLPGGYIEAIINGQFIGSISNARFAKALWGLWFNHEKPAPQNSLLSAGL
ncbi:Uncharacterized protein PHSC3_000444 [Chlamydiales bacterium STE3]|nr:Uncharacterized protein PHSC3_000444 [Chlamydiales bacterium STE3]